jgi:hypothetical protein
VQLTHSHRVYLGDVIGMIPSSYKTNNHKLLHFFFFFAFLFVFVLAVLVVAVVVMLSVFVFFFCLFACEIVRVGKNATLS